MKNLFLHFKYHLILLVFIVFFQWILPYFPSGQELLILYVLSPVQKLRSLLLNMLPISFGDLLYTVLTILGLVFLTQWILALFKVKSQPRKALQSSKRLSLWVLILVLGFSFFWNVYYYREKMYSQFKDWKEVEMDADKEFLLAQHILLQFERLESQRPLFKEDQDWSKSIQQTYLQLFPQAPSLRIKKSWFAFAMPAMGIHGYYNPLSSEAQYNPRLPYFLHPFLIAHEWAHVLGIAAEGEANFLAYYICTSSNEPALEYSAYLNLYMYNINRLQAFDSIRADQIKKNLPQYVRDDFYTLRAYYDSHPAYLNKWSQAFLDRFLKINGQQDGVSSYSHITKYAYILDLIEKERTNISIRPYNH